MLNNIMNKEYLIRLNNQKLRNEQVLSKKLKENRMLGVGEIDMFGSSDGIALDGTEATPNVQRYEEEAKFLLNKYISDSQAINRIVNSLSERQLRSLVLNFTSIEANLLENLQSQRVDKNIFLEQLKDEINKNIKLSDTGSAATAAPSAVAPSTPLPSTPVPSTPQKRGSPASSTPSMTPLPARINSSSSTGSGDKDKILEAISQLLYTNNISQKIYNTLVANFNLYSTGIDEEDFNEIKTNLGLIVEYDDYQKSFKNFLVDNSKEIFNKTYVKPKSVEDVKKRFKTLPLAVLITFFSVASKEVPLAKKSGKGLNPDLHYHLNDKYYIPKAKLGAGILEVRYTKNKHLTNLKPQYMSNELKKVVNDIVSRKTFDTKDYHKMNIFDQNIARMLNEKVLGGAVNVYDDNSMDSKFQVLIGSLRAGNNNIQLQSQVRRFILHAISTGRMPRNTGYDILTELSL